MLGAARAGRNLDATCPRRRSPAAPARSTSSAPSTARASSASNAMTGDPNHLGIMLDVPLLILTPIYLRLRAAPHASWRRRRSAFLLLVEFATLSRSGVARPPRRRADPRAPVPALPPLAGAALSARRRARRPARSSCSRGATSSRSSSTRASQTGGSSTNAHFPSTRFVARHPAHAPAASGSASTPSRSTTSSSRASRTSGPHSYWVALIVETGLVGLLFGRSSSATSSCRLRAPGPRPAARPARATRTPPHVRPLACGMTAALVGDDRRERLLPDDAVLLLLRVPGLRARPAGRLRRPWP